VERDTNAPIRAFARPQISRPSFIPSFNGTAPPGKCPFAAPGPWYCNSAIEYRFTVHKNIASFLAASLVVVSCAGAAPAAAQGLDAETFNFEGFGESKPLQGNWLRDQQYRQVKVYFPDGYCRKPNHCSNPDERYPVIYVLPGLLMFDMEGAIDALVDQRQPHLQENHPTYAGFTFDMDGVARKVMGELNREFLMVEVTGITGSGGSWYDCSPVFGDYRSFVRQLVDEIDDRYRTIADRDARVLVGYSMGGYGALALAIEYPETFGALGLLSPAINNVELGQVNGELSLVFIGRVTPHADPFSLDLTTHKLMRARDTDAIQGDAPASPFSPDHFFAHSIWTGHQAKVPNRDARNFADSFFVDHDNRATSPTNPVVVQKWKDTDNASRVAAGGGNLARTPVFFGSGNSNRIPLHREIPDLAGLEAALNQKGVAYNRVVVNGDHYTSLGTHPDNPVAGTFELALKDLLPRLGSQSGNPSTYDATLATEHASCAAYTPGN
jgi:pimeloyl-ACP methyl ester carboxylesterase